MDKLFSEADLDRIRQAVHDAEQHTSGEIVLFIMPESDPYEVAVWRGAALFAVSALALSVAVFQFYQGWGLAWLYTGWGVALTALLVGTLGAVLSNYVAPLKRVLVGGATLDRAVHERALRAFVEEEVFNTRDRTGILLFISLFERRIEVVGDAGINSKVTADEWVDIVTRIREGILQNKVADGMVAAIALCGTLLEKRGVEIKPDDTNELPDGVRFRRDL